MKNRHTPPIEVNLRFDKMYFHHLCGLHKLKDLEYIKSGRRDLVFDKIIQGVYPDSLFESSTEYSKIQDRIDCLEALETMLDDDNTVFKFNASVDKHSAIEADFIIKNESSSLRRYYFVSESEETKGQFFGRSCFSRTASERDYTKGHTTYTVLRKTKVQLSTQQKEDLYIAPSYKRELESNRQEQDVSHIQKIEFRQFPTAAPDGTAVLNPTAIPSPPPMSDLLSKLKRSLSNLAKRIKKSVTSEKTHPAKQSKKSPTKRTQHRQDKPEEKQPITISAPPTQDKPKQPTTSCSQLRQNQAAQKKREQEEAALGIGMKSVHHSKNRSDDGLS